MNNLNKRQSETVIQGYPDLAQKGSDEIEIDLLEMLFFLLSKLKYILLFTVLGGILFNAYAFFCITPTYQATSKLYVVTASDNQTVNYYDVSIGTQLKADYENLIHSYTILDAVIKNLDLDMDYNQLSGKISIANPADTRVLDITVVTTDPKLSMDIANEVASVSVQLLPTTMQTSSPSIAQHAQLPEAKANPSYTKYTIIGALLGLVISCAYFIVIFMMDDTIHSAEDLEKHFGLVPLAVVPESDDMLKQNLADKKATIEAKKRANKTSTKRRVRRA